MECYVAGDAAEGPNEGHLQHSSKLSSRTGMPRSRGLKAKRQRALMPHGGDTAEARACMAPSMAVWHCGHHVADAALRIDIRALVGKKQGSRPSCSDRVPQEHDGAHAQSHAMPCHATQVARPGLRIGTEVLTIITKNSHHCNHDAMAAWRSIASASQQLSVPCVE